MFRTPKVLRPLCRAGYLCCAAAILIANTATVVLADNPGSGKTSKGQALNIRIDEDVKATNYESGDPATVTGVANIGELMNQASVLYVVDVSGSTQSPLSQDCDGNGIADIGDDLNLDNSVGDTLDCEISGLISLHESLRSTTVVSTGLVAFGSDAAIADLSPADGIQFFASAESPDVDENGFLDIQDVAYSLGHGAVNLFSTKFVGEGTSFDNALTAINESFSSITDGDKVAFFLSDGQSDVQQGSGTQLERANAAGISIYTYSVGPDGTGCAEGASLRVIADETGGLCTEVADPAQLSAVLPSTPPDQIERVDLHAGDVTYPTNFNQAGVWSVALPGDVVQFPMTVKATVYATDGTTATAELELLQPGNLVPIDEPDDVDSLPLRFGLFFPFVHGD